MTLLKENTSSRNSVQSATSSLWFSKIVPFVGLKVLPHALHSHLCKPLASRPLRLMSGEPHRGHDSRV